MKMKTCRGIHIVRVMCLALRGARYKIINRIDVQLVTMLVVVFDLWLAIIGAARGSRGAFSLVC